MDGALILSRVVPGWADFFIILLLRVSDVVVGFWEEARELVGRNVIRARLGDIVPADARLLAGDPVKVDQSALTGEAMIRLSRAGAETSEHISVPAASNFVKFRRIAPPVDGVAFLLGRNLRKVYCGHSVHISEGIAQERS